MNPTRLQASSGTSKQNYLFQPSCWSDDGDGAAGVVCREVRCFYHCCYCCCHYRYQSYWWYLARRLHPLPQMSLYVTPQAYSDASVSTVSLCLVKPYFFLLFSSSTSLGLQKHVLVFSKKRNRKKAKRSRSSTCLRQLWRERERYAALKIEGGWSALPFRCGGV